MIKKFESFGKKKVIIFHGLGGSPSLDRTSIMEDIGYTVEYPHIDYVYEWELDKCKSLFERTLNLSKDCDLVIGVSLGGYLGNLIANNLGIDCILINPALDRDKTKLDIKDFDCEKKLNNCDSEIYLGKLDTLIPMEITLDYIKNNNIKSNVSIIDNMEHRCNMRNFLKILKLSKFI
jgi:hypothetical protein